MPHKTTKANANSKRVAKVEVQCTSCGTRMAMSEEDMEKTPPDVQTKIAQPIKKQAMTMIWKKNLQLN